MPYRMVPTLAAVARRASQALAAGACVCVCVCVCVGVCVCVCVWPVLLKRGVYMWLGSRSSRTAGVRLPSLALLGPAVLPGDKNLSRVGRGAL